MNEPTHCDNHHDEIIKIQTEFQHYKKTTNHRLDEILEKLETRQFSNYQITMFLVVLVTSLASMMIYITDIKSDSRLNAQKITTLEVVDQHLQQVDEKRELQFDNIMIMLAQIQTELKNEK
ncbi:hypothetical protein [Candidatus Venteria ishoeyi]|uniref:Uncharacterized protein n=1 Tax=Candidatus Venteria ishoeyi TaxID=1899563 RepID=A0A1H6F899_9GAMM|nr:hypothetical protein [Candidatus Venteria ishoeyi]SEH05274.1 Uncharacterised protein [Candidatus Venteria ishoeyi]